MFIAFQPLLKIIYYWQIYFEAIDLIVNCINDRFDQQGFEIYQNVQNLILQVVNSEEYNSCNWFICIRLWSSPAESSELHVLFTTFSNVENASILLPDIIKYFRTRSPVEPALYSEIGTLFKLLLAMPISNAVSEQSFSALCRIKSYLSSSMTQERLNHFTTLQIHQDLTDDLDLKSCTNALILLIKMNIR